MIEIYNKENYKIFTMDDKGNLFIGHLEVKDVEKLCRLRDFLLRNKTYNFTRTNRRTGIANNIEIPKVEVIDKFLIRRTNFTVESDKTYYDEYIYKSLNLNSVLIFTSLLGELGFNNYGLIAKRFIDNGIIKVLPLSQIWYDCIKNLLKNKDSQDYELFCDVLNNGEFIEYVVDEVIDTKEANVEGVFNQLQVKLNEVVDGISEHDVCKKEFLDEINCNSQMLGICRRNKVLKK